MIRDGAARGEARRHALVARRLQGEAAEAAGQGPQRPGVAEGLRQRHLGAEDVLRAAQVAWPGCEAVVTTAFGDEAHVLAAIEAGASGYLLKDSTPEKVVEEIRLLHAGGSPISPLRVACAPGVTTMS